MASGQRGLSIIELLAVVTILGILASIVTPVAQVVITREIELDLMRHLRGIRRGIDTYHETAVKCWEDTCRSQGLHTVNQKWQERCRVCGFLLVGVMCRVCQGWNSRSRRECQWGLTQVPPVITDLDQVRCPNSTCTNNTSNPIIFITAVNNLTGRFVDRCPTCGTSLIQYRENSLTNYPTSFQDMYMLNTLRISHAYNPVTASREDWDITLFRPPGSRTMDLRFSGTDKDGNPRTGNILTYLNGNPATATVVDGYPRQEGTNGLLRYGNGYILEAWEWKSMLTNGQLDMDKWVAWCKQPDHTITVWDLGSNDWMTFTQIKVTYPDAFVGVSGTGSGIGTLFGQVFLPQIYDVHFPLSSTRNKKTLNGKKIYSDL